LTRREFLTAGLILASCKEEYMNVKKISWFLNSGGGSSSAFTDVWGWWRADTYTGSSPNIVLTDKSANARDMTQAAGTLTPGISTNGQAKLTGGSTARLTSSASLSSWPVTMMTVFKRASGATCGFFGHTGATGYNGLWYGYESVDRFAVYNTNNTLNTTAETAAPACYTARIGHGSRVSFLNGVILPIMGRSILKGPSGPTTVTLGTEYRGLNGDWQETLVWDRVLTLAEMDEVNTYINTRYSMSIPLWSSYTQTPTIWMGGQSNSSGRGDRGASDVNIPATYKVALTGVNVWYGTRTFGIGSAFETLDITANNQELGDEVQAPTYIGHELSMCKDYIDRVGGSVYLMKYATGGTNLAYLAGGYWHPTDYHSGGVAHNSQNRLYGQSTENWWQSLRIHQAAGRIPQIKGIVWYQGEQDATNSPDANNYSANGVILFTTLTPELGFAIGSVKKFIMRLNIFCNSTYTSTLRSQQATLVSSLSNAVLVDTDSYGLRGGDIVHLSYQGQLDLGSYLATQL
jgi:hypothetical protein